MATVTESERPKNIQRQYCAEKEKIFNASCEPVLIENNDSGPKEIDQNVKVRKTSGMDDEECNRYENHLKEGERLESSAEKENKEEKAKVMTDDPDINLEDYQIYLKQIKESQGFDVGRFTNIGRLGLIVPVLHDQRKQALRYCSEEAIKVYNTNENTNYKFHEVIKATLRICSGTMYFITFQAIDPSDQSCEIFQARVWHKLANQGVEVELIRKKPTQ